MAEEVRYERNPDFIFRTIVDEAVLVPIHRQVADMDCIYTLNGVGAFVWGKLEGRPTRTELRDAIVAEYAVDAETAAADLDAFLAGMTEVGAVARV